MVFFLSFALNKFFRVGLFAITISVEIVAIRTYVLLPS